MKREYNFLAYRPGGFMFWPGKSISSNARIRAVLITVFRHWFGREPNFVWSKDGFMGGARDERGNEVELEQINWGHPRNRARAFMTERLISLSESQNVRALLAPIQKEAL